MIAMDLIHYRRWKLNATLSYQSQNRLLYNLVIDHSVMSDGWCPAEKARGTIGRISLAADQDKSKRQVIGMPQIQAESTDLLADKCTYIMRYINVYYRSWALQTMKGILLVTHDWMSNRCNSCCLGWWWHYSNLAFSERWAKRFQYVLGPVFSCLACAWDVRSDAPSTLHIPARAGLSYSWASNSSRFEGREWVGLHLVGCFSWITHFVDFWQAFHQQSWQRCQISSSCQ